MTCIYGETWDATVSGIDAAALGAAIAAGEAVQVSVSADGDPNKVPLSGFLPVSFGGMYGESLSGFLPRDQFRRDVRGYSMTFICTLDDLGAAASLVVNGTVLNFPSAFPPGGLPRPSREFKVFFFFCGNIR